MFELPESLTVWTEVSNDGAGTKIYSRSVVSGRTALKQEKFTDVNGDQQVSKAVCYSESPLLAAGAIVYFGESTEDQPLDAADDVRAISSTPSFTSMRKAWF